MQLTVIAKRIFKVATPILMVGALSPQVFADTSHSTLASCTAGSPYYTCGAGKIYNVANNQSDPSQEHGAFQYKFNSWSGGKFSSYGDAIIQDALGASFIPLISTQIQPSDPASQPVSYPLNSWMAGFFWNQYYKVGTISGNSACKGKYLEQTCNINFPDMTGGIDHDKNSFAYAEPMSYSTTIGETAKEGDDYAVQIDALGPYKAIIKSDVSATHTNYNYDMLQYGDDSITKKHATPDYYLMAAEQDPDTAGNRSDLPTHNAQITKLGIWSSDLTVKTTLPNDNRGFTMTIAEGSPFNFFTVNAGTDVKINVPNVTATSNPKIYTFKGLNGDGNNYAIYLSGGLTIAKTTNDSYIVNPNKSTSTTPAYFTIALLPAGDPATEANTLQKYAFNFITGTTLKWTLNNNGDVTTTYTDTLAYHGDGSQPTKNTLMGVFPNQYTTLPSDRGNVMGSTTFAPEKFNTSMGDMKTVDGTSFSTTFTYPGILPYMPTSDAKTDPDGNTQLTTFMDSFNKAHPTLTPSTDYNSYTVYNGGQTLNQYTQALPIANSLGVNASGLATSFQSMFEKWFQGNPQQVGANKIGNFYFGYDQRYGNLFGEFGDYGQSELSNDHILQFGYYINSAAMFDLWNKANSGKPGSAADWDTDQQWGAIVKTLIRDIADIDDVSNSSGTWSETLTGTDSSGHSFVPLKGFDAYMGHAWASGYNTDGTGPNLESSSEAINSYVGMINWGQTSNNQNITATGIYMYTTAIHAAWANRFGKAPNIYKDTTDPSETPNYMSNFPSSAQSACGATNYPGMAGRITASGPRETLFLANDGGLTQLAMNSLPLTGGSFYLGMEPSYGQDNYCILRNNVDKYSAEGPASSAINSYPNTNAGYVGLSSLDLSKPYDAKSAAPQQALFNTDGSVNSYFWQPDDSRANLSGESSLHTYQYLRALYNYGHPDFSFHSDNVMTTTPLYSVFTKADGTSTLFAYNATGAKMTVNVSNGSTTCTADVGPYSMGQGTCGSGPKPIQPPTNIAGVEDKTGNEALTWTEASTGVTGYTINVTDSKGAVVDTETSSSTSVSIPVAKLAAHPDTSYNVSITATDGKQKSGPGTGNFTYTSVGPDAPSSIAGAEDATGNEALTWTETSTDVKSYTVTVTDSKGTTVDTETPTSTNVTIPVAKFAGHPDGTYNVSITATDGTQTSKPGTGSFAYKGVTPPPVKPDAPTAIAGTEDSTGNETLNWSETTQGVTSYNVTVTAPDGKNIYTGSPSATSVKIPVASFANHPDGSYNVSITASEGGQTSTPGTGNFAYKHIAPPPPVGPATPTSVTVQDHGHAGATVSWSESGTTTGYSYTVYIGGKATFNVPASSTSISIDGSYFPSQGAYTASVVATDAGKSSTPSKPVPFTHQY